MEKSIQFLVQAKKQKTIWRIILESDCVQGENMESNRRKPLMAK